MYDLNRLIYNAGIYLKYKGDSENYRKSMVAEGYLCWAVVGKWESIVADYEKVKGLSETTIKEMFNFITTE